MGSAPYGALAFLAVNFTLFLPLFAWAAFRAWRGGDREGLATLVPGLALWGALFFVMLAPWDWDNTKVMIWCYVLMLPAAERLVLRPMPRAAALACGALLLAPGALLVGDSLGPRRLYEVIDGAELAQVCEALASAPSTSRVATAQAFSHPVALCGHPLVAGYSGHLWSHGIKAAAVEETLRGLMLGRPGWEGDARTLEARYVFWGPREAEAFVGSARPWEDKARLVASGGWGSLYELASPSGRP